jgi:DNA-binding transcriptional regulator YdaS (Cro superfamily)
MNALTKSVLAVLDAVPCSDRKLAEAAGVQPASLSRARQGRRPITADVADAIAAALERWARECQRGARAIRNASKPRKGAR